MTGVDLHGYRRGIDSYAIRHTFRKHGDPVHERRRGQAAVTDDDYAMIPRIVALPDLLRNGGITKIGRQVVLYQRSFGDTLYSYAEEARPKRHFAMMLTMWKRPAT